MSFVDFMIIGAMKSGTSTLAEILSMHPEVCFCQEKEPHFFSKTSDWKANLEDYKNLYNPQEEQICGEASTTYTCYPEFNKNIWDDLYKFNPKLKLIYIMRDPVERIVSHYMHNYLRSYTSESLEKAVLSQSTYINRTRYFVHIRPYLDIFGKEQVLLLTFEELMANKKMTLNKIADFLNIDRAKFYDFENVHANKSVGETKPDVRIDNFRKSNIVNPLKPFVPKYLRTIASDFLYKMTEKKFNIRPNISEELKSVIWDLLILDVLEIEKLMGRKIIEWKSLNTDKGIERESVIGVEI